MIILEIAQFQNTFNPFLSYSLEFVFLKTGRNGEKCLCVSGLSSVTHDAFVFLGAHESQLKFRYPLPDCHSLVPGK